jgi:hypothetical protein
VTYRLNRPCLDCGKLTRNPSVCDDCQRQRWRNREKTRSTEDEGPGAEHQRLRKQVARAIADGALVHCCRCGLPISRVDDFHLDHSDDRTGYRGVSHAFCNLSVGGKLRHPGRVKISVDLRRLVPGRAMRPKHQNLDFLKFSSPLDGINKDRPKPLHPASGLSRSRHADHSDGETNHHLAQAIPWPNADLLQQTASASTAKD